ncbi:MAG: heavy-metal-associated domain-containing protein, partial [Dietzia sp.]|nr:heavy-metal-associated domain-containing protein [Dietzia sp.]
MTETTVLSLGGLHWATSAPIIESTLARRPGVVAVSANAANQTATVTYEPARTSVAELATWIRDCGFHCAGRAVPDHICDPMADGGAP